MCVMAGQHKLFSSLGNLIKTLQTCHLTNNELTSANIPSVMDCLGLGHLDQLIPYVNEEPIS